MHYKYKKIIDVGGTMLFANEIEDSRASYIAYQIESAFSCPAEIDDYANWLSKGGWERCKLEDPK